MKSIVAFLVGVVAVVSLALGMGLRHARSMAFSRAAALGDGSAATRVAEQGSTGIQTGAKVIDVTDSQGSTKIGIMGAYDPASRSFWWRPTPMIAESEMLERFYGRCKFVMDAGRVVNVCVRGSEVVTTTTAEYRASFDEGMAAAEEALRQNPGLSMGFAGPRDFSFDLRVKAGIDANTPAGVAPTVVKSVTSTGSGLAVYLTCSCGDVVITMNRNYDFVDLKKI